MVIGRSAYRLLFYIDLKAALTGGIRLTGSLYELAIPT